MNLTTLKLFGISIEPDKGYS